jgi:hypothetical protein
MCAKRVAARASPDHADEPHAGNMACFLLDKRHIPSFCTQLACRSGLSSRRAAAVFRAFGLENGMPA